MNDYDGGMTLTLPVGMIVTLTLTLGMTVTLTLTLGMGVTLTLTLGMCDSDLDTGNECEVFLLEVLEMFQGRLKVKDALRGRGVGETGVGDRRNLLSQGAEPGRTDGHTPPIVLPRRHFYLDKNTIIH